MKRLFSFLVLVFSSCASGYYQYPQESDSWQNLADGADAVSQRQRARGDALRARARGPRTYDANCTTQRLGHIQRIHCEEQ